MREILEVSIEVLTPMFSYSISKEPEFRVTELKSLMRSTLREYYSWHSLSEMKKEESRLFGSLNKKSPIIFRIKNKKLNINYKNLVLHKDTELKCIDKGSKIQLYMIIDIDNKENKEKVVKEYIDLLLLSAIIGGVGKRSRKGLGSFIIRDINELKNQKEYNEYVKEQTKTIIENLRNRECDKYLEYPYMEKRKEKSNKYMDYPYIKRINIIEKSKDELYTDLYKVSSLTHERLSTDFINLNLKKFKAINVVLGNCRCSSTKIQRFASPVCITYYEYNEKKIMIIKELNYDYILEKIEICNQEKKYIADKYVNKYIEELKR